MIRGKFRCQSVQEHTDQQGGEVEPTKYSEYVTLFPVTGHAGESAENKTFWKATPSGKLELSVDNPEAWGHFQEGGEYFIDITRAH